MIGFNSDGHSYPHVKLGDLLLFYLLSQFDQRTVLTMQDSHA